jgi:hypothetical protein
MSHESVPASLAQLVQHAQAAFGETRGGTCRVRGGHGTPMEEGTGHGGHGTPMEEGTGASSWSHGAVLAPDASAYASP